MIEVTCPKCGGMGRAPREKVNTRLVCRKCHSVFHIATSGRALLGEPARQPKDGRQRTETAAPSKPGTDWKENLPEFTMTGRSGAIAAAVLLVVGVGYFMLSRPAETLTERAKITAQYFADGDLPRLKAEAFNGSADDLVQWYGRLHPELEALQKSWAGQQVLVGVLVIDENVRMRSGQVTAILAPSKPNARDASVHDAADVGGLTAKPLEIMFYFTPDSWGKWRVDGKKMRDQSTAPL